MVHELGPSPLWRTCGCLEGRLRYHAGQLADHVAAWGEMRPEPWEEFVADAEAARELVEQGDEDARDDHLALLEHLEDLSYSWRISLEACYREVVEDTRRLH